MEIILHTKYIQEAKEYALKSRSFTSNRHDFHEGGLNAKQRKMLEGKIGEKSVKQLFDEHNIYYVEDQSNYWEEDEFDFIVYDKKGDPHTVDVKTRTENFHIRTLEMVEQFEKNPKSVYISVRLFKKSSPPRLTILGYCTKNDISRINRVENNGYLDNYVLFDNELKSIDILLEKIKKKT